VKVRSFHVHVFVFLLAVAIAIIVSNRVIAQYFLTQQLRVQIQVDMGRALINCSGNIQDKPKFFACSHSMDEGSLLGSAADYYVLCPNLSHTTEGMQASACAAPFAQVPIRLPLEGMDANVELLSGLRQGELWYQAKRTDIADSPVLLLKQSDADLFLDRLWKVRDRNLLRVAPIVLILLAIFSWLSVRMMLRPLRLIEQTISNLNDSNLGQASDLKAPYREFESFVSVYDSLRTRLFESFNKARRFSSDVSHELRTPLTILRGNTEQLIRDLPLGSDLQVRVRNMGDEVERLIDITEKLLMISRADANSLGRSFSHENLSDMVEQLITQVEDQDHLAVPFAITSAIEPQVLWCCDKTLVKLLIHNLFENAQKYNVTQGWIHLTLAREGNALRLSLENSSENIAADLEARAFDRFYRGDASHTRQIDGLGLGLSICSEIARIHHGTLTLGVTQANTVLLTLTAPLNTPT
jgi:signal transduction histidine kinase